MWAPAPARTLSVVAFLALSWGCGRADSNPERTTAQAPTPECVRQAYPCTLGEVDPAVTAREDTLAQEVADQLLAEVPAEQLQSMLDERPEVVAAAVDSTTVRFRLRGGRPVWVVLRTPDVRGGGGSPVSSASSLDSPVASAPRSGFALPAALPDVVGKGTPRPLEKRALVLSPMQFEFGQTDEGAWAAAQLRETRGYEDGVDYFANTAESGAVQISHFTGWSAYDVVLVATHGVRSCRGERCWVGLATGIQGCRTSAELRTGGVSRGFTVLLTPPRPPADPNEAIDFPNELADLAGPELALAKPHWGCMLESDFFAIHYPTGLDKTIVVLNACQLAEGPEMAFNLTGENSVFFGWTTWVDSRVAYAFAQGLIGRLAREGTTTERFYESRFQSFEALPYNSYEGLSMTGWSRQVVMYETGSPLRMREVVWLLDTETEQEVNDGALLDVVGTPDDGEPDALRLLFQVDGIGPDDDPSRYRLFLDVTPSGGGWERGIVVDDRFSAADVKDGVARKLVEVPLERDLKSDELYELRPGVELPEGGESRWLYEDMRVAGWELEVLSGPHAGVYRGSDAAGRGGIDYSEDSPPNLIARAEELGYGVQHFTFNTEEDADKVVLVTMGVEAMTAAGGVSRPGIYSIPKDLDVVMEYDRIITGESDLHDAYQAGDGSVTSSFTFPPPSTLQVEAVSRSQVVGTIRGTLWTSDPPDFASVGFRMRFRARRCLFGTGLSGRECTPIPEWVDLDSDDENTDSDPNDDAPGDPGDGPEDLLQGSGSGTSTSGAASVVGTGVLVEFGVASNFGFPSALEAPAQRSTAVQRSRRWDVSAPEFRLAFHPAGGLSTCDALGLGEILGSEITGSLSVMADATAGQFALTFVPSEGPLQGDTLRVTAEGTGFNPYADAPGVDGYRIAKGDLEHARPGAASSERGVCRDAVDLGLRIYHVP